MLVGINGEAGEPGDFARERLTKTRRAPSHRVLMMRPSRGAFERGEQFLRRIEIRKTLREIDRAVLVSKTCHCPDHRFRKSGKSGRGRWHNMNRLSDDDESLHYPAR